MLDISGGRGLLFVCGLLVTLLGGWTAYQEAAPNFRGGATPIERLMAMPDGKAPAGLTLRSQRSALLDCEVALRSYQSIQMQFQTQEAQQHIANVCAELGARLSASNPSDPLAWLVVAAAAAHGNDLAKFNLGLERSQIVAPNEGWIASLRVDWAGKYAEALSPAASAGYDHDLANVAASYSAYWMLAGRYVDEPAFRQRMTTVLQTMPPESQAHFLGGVKSVLAASNR
jgi:hypothetical protein